MIFLENAIELLLLFPFSEWLQGNFILSLTPAVLQKAEMKLAESCIELQTKVSILSEINCTSTLSNCMESKLLS